MGCIAPKPRKRTEPKPLQPGPSQVAEPQAESLRASLQVVPAASSTTRKIIVRTKLTTADVQCSEVTPHSTSRLDFKYNCPICLKYLSSILITQCCRNYLCHFCLADYQTKEVHFQVCCPMCNAEPLVLDDVDPSADVKRYSDSPYSTLGANRSSQAGPKWVSKLAIVEEDEKLAKELEDELPEVQADVNEREAAPIGFSSTA